MMLDGTSGSSKACESIISGLSSWKLGSLKPLPSSNGTENERPKSLFRSNSVQSTQSKQEKSHSSQVS